LKKLYYKHIYFPILRLKRLVQGSKWVAAGSLIFDDDGRMLLIYHRWRRAWEYPMGITDPGESPLEAAQREVYEEVGLKPQDFALTAVDFFERARTPNGSLALTFTSRVSGHQPHTVKLDPFEATDYRWVTREEALKLISPRLRGRLAELFTAHDAGSTVYLHRGVPIAN
jgi:8-oxo-dGTP diphosphatase